MIRCGGWDSGENKSRENDFKYLCWTISKILSANLFTCKRTYMTDWVGRSRRVYGSTFIVEVDCTVHPIAWALWLYLQVHSCNWGAWACRSSWNKSACDRHVTHFTVTTRTQRHPHAGCHKHYGCPRMFGANQPQNWPMSPPARTCNARRPKSCWQPQAKVPAAHATLKPTWCGTPYESSAWAAARKSTNNQVLWENARLPHSRVCGPHKAGSSVSHTWDRCCRLLSPPPAVPQVQPPSVPVALTLWVLPSSLLDPPLLTRLGLSREANFGCFCPLATSGQGKPKKFPCPQGTGANAQCQVWLKINENFVHSN